VIVKPDIALRIFLPSATDEQTHWLVDSLNNRYLAGDNWTARDWFPVPIPVNVKVIEYPISKEPLTSTL
jgi:hypothetical protein